MFLELAKNRYSCRNYLSKKIENEKLARVLEAGNLAPTAKNMQPHRIYLLESEESLKKIDSLTRCRFGAPMVILS